MSSVLDAWAISALLRGEPAGPRVRRAIEEGSVCSWINLGEALYVEVRRQGEERAASAITRLAQSMTVEAADPALVQAAARIKADGGISYPDCFAVATAERHGLPLLTGDPEIIELDRPGLDIIDLREE